MTVKTTESGSACSELEAATETDKTHAEYPSSAMALSMEEAESGSACSEIEAGIEVHCGEDGDTITDSNTTTNLAVDQNATVDETISIDDSNDVEIECGGEQILTTQYEIDGTETCTDVAAPSGRSGIVSVARAFKPLLCVFPKVEPLPWGNFAVLTIWCALLPAGYILLFTQMGYGEQLYYATAEKIGEYAYGLALCLAASVFFLYMLDGDEWTSQDGQIFLCLFSFAIVCGVVLLVLLIADLFPYGMVCLFAVMYPLWLLALKLMCYSNKDTRTFVSWLSGPLFFISLVVGATWIGWVFSDPDNEWNDVARVVAAERTQCTPIYTNHEYCQEAGSEKTCFYVDTSDGKETLVFPEGCDQSCTEVYSDCLNGFILWLGPVLVGMTAFFLSFFCTFLRTEGAREKDVLNFGAIWIFLLFALWVTTSLAGTAAGVTASLAGLTLASFVASAMFIAVSFSKEERSKNSAAVFERLNKKYGKHLDYARALFVVTCAPIVLVYLGFSMMNQLVRRTGFFPCSQPPGEGSDKFTARARKQVNVMKSWHRARVYTYAVYWGIAFMILQVLVAKVTVVFLSWVIEKTEGISLPAVTAIMAVMSVIMFLLPPVPGVPIYLTLGIVLPAQASKQFGWAGSIAYSIAISLMLKLFSSAMQQKLIGENLSHHVKVRQFVTINSSLMKAMRIVLGKDGLSVPKVAILMGGPDWPTSVLCGIMKLSLPQIMLGTLPVVFLIAPTCSTGTLLYMADLKDSTGNPEFPWAKTVSAITTSLTAVVGFGAMIVAAYYLEQTAGKRAAELEAIPDDKEVKEADDKAEHLNKCYQDVTQWNVAPRFAKILLKISLVFIVTSCYMVQLFSNLCFVEHSLTDRMDDTKKLDGSFWNLFKPLGWVASGLCCISIILICLFQHWGQHEAVKLSNQNVASVHPIESSSDKSSTAEVAEPRLSGSAKFEDVERSLPSQPLLTRTNSSP